MSKDKCAGCIQILGELLAEKNEKIKDLLELIDHLQNTIDCLTDELGECDDDTI